MRMPWLWSAGLLTTMLACPVAAQPRLRVHPDNPHWFDYGGRAIALFGSGLWTIIPDGRVDIEDHNAWYASYGANSNRASLFAFCTSVPDGRGLAPWIRTGPGTANDGGPRFDLSRWDERFWGRLHAYLSDCERRGIIVLLQMWDEPYVEGGPERWRLNPFNPENHINDLPGLPGGAGSGEVAFYDPDNAPLMAVQDALIRRLLDETARRYGNLIYEIGNEINMDSRTPKEVAWQQHWIDLFRAYERERGVELLLSNDTRESVFREGADGFGVINQHGFAGLQLSLQEIGDLPADVADAVRRDMERYRKPILNSRPCSDPDRQDYPDIPTPEVARALYWSYFCGGGQVIGFRTTEDSWKGGLAAERVIESVQTFIRRVRLERLWPHRELVDHGLCLADPGREYVVYRARPGETTIDLTAVRGRLTATWYNPRASRDERREPVVGGARRSFRTPGEGDWVLHLKRAAP